MKTLLCVILVFTLLSAAGFHPFRSNEPQELNPAETVVADFTGDGVKLTTDKGQTGSGTTWEQAVADLKNTSVGTAFLQTAEKVIVVGAEALDLAAMALSDALRPAAEVYGAESGVDAEQANEYLKTRSSEVNVGELHTAFAQREEVPILPQLEEENETVKLHEDN